MAFDIEPNPEVVEDEEAGLLVPAGDVRKFAQAIMAMLDKKNWRNK